LPVFLFDTLRLTSRFAGPALRLRAALSDASQGLPVRPIQFRHDDFWQEMADSFNTLMERQKEAERIVQESQHALAANSDGRSSLANPFGTSKSNSHAVRSADEALRLLDSVTA